MTSTIESLLHTGEDADLISALSAFIAREMSYRDVPGVSVALGREGELVWSGAFGFADLAAGRPMQTDSVFKSGSMGKTYTGTAIMQLAERGAVALDQPIDELLPFPVENPLGGEITVRHLMTHTSGIGTTLVDCCTSPQTRPLAELLADYVQRESDGTFGGETDPIWLAPAGDSWCYSNLGIGLLGLIVEGNNGHGLTFSDYIQQHIMDPLGMEYAAYPPVQAEHAVPPEIWKRLMTGHTAQAGVTYTAPSIYFQVFPAGAFVSTASDHLRLVMAMLNGGELNGFRVLSEESVTEMLAPQGHALAGRPHGVAAEQGLIWRLDRPDGRIRRFHHAGGHMYGFQTQAAGWPDERVAVVAGCNSWPLGVKYFSALPQRIADFVDDWLTMGRDAPDSPRHDGSRSWAWKVSYVRGARFIEANNQALGLSDPLDIDDARAAARSSSTGSVEDWDEAAFVEGAADMLGVPLSAAAIADFARSDRFKLTSSEAARVLWFLEGPTEQRVGLWHSFLEPERP